MEGRATLTIDASSTTMNWPMRTMPRTSQDGTVRPGEISTAVASLPRMRAPCASAFRVRRPPVRDDQRRSHAGYSHPTGRTPGLLAGFGPPADFDFEGKTRHSAPL